MDTPEIDLSDFERELRRLKAGSLKIDRDQFWFEAGRVSGRGDHQGRAALILALICSVVAVGFVGLFLREHAERAALEVKLAAQERTMSPPESVVETPRQPLDPDSYLALRQTLMVGLTEPSFPSSGSPVRDSGPNRLPIIPEPLRVRGSDGSISF